MTLSTTLCHYVECRLIQMSHFIVMLTVVMLRVEALYFNGAANIYQMSIGLMTNYLGRPRKLAHFQKGGSGLAVYRDSFYIELAEVSVIELDIDLKLQTDIKRFEIMYELCNFENAPYSLQRPLGWASSAPPLFGTMYNYNFIYMFFNLRPDSRRKNEFPASNSASSGNRGKLKGPSVVTNKKLLSSMGAHALC